MRSPKKYLRAVTEWSSSHTCPANVLRSGIHTPKVSSTALTSPKPKVHMVRACMEGVALSLRHNLEIAEEAGAKVERPQSHGRLRQLPPLDPDQGRHHRQTNRSPSLRHSHNPGSSPPGRSRNRPLQRLRRSRNPDRKRNTSPRARSGQQNSLRPDLPNLPGSLQIPGPPDDQTLRVCIHLRIQIYIITSNIVPLRTTFLTGTS